MCENEMETKTEKVTKMEEEIIFPVGMRVEVRDNNEGYGGAWFTATVISTPSSSTSSVKRKKSLKPPQTLDQMYLVKYADILDDKDPTQPLTELIHVSSIRPSPPIPDTNVAGDGSFSFEVNDAVDAFHHDGWWPGVVRAFADDGSGPSQSFVIDFDNPPDRIVCHGSDLRLHFDWVNRDWVQPGKQISDDANSNTDFTQSLKKFKARNAVEGQLSITPPRRLVTTRNKDANSSTDVTQGSEKFKASNAAEGQPSITTPCGPVITHNIDDSSGFTSAVKGGTGNDCFKQSSDDGPLSAENKSRTRKRIESKEQIVGGPKSATGHKRKKTRAKKSSYSERLSASAKGNECNTTEDLLEKKHLKNVMIAKETQGSEAENSDLLPEKASSESVRDQDPHAMGPEESITEINKSISEESLVRRKRGRPRKSYGKISNGSAKGERHEVAAGPLNQTVLKGGATNVMALHTQVRKGNIRTDSCDNFPHLSKECLKLMADTTRFLSGACLSSKRKPLESRYDLLNLTVTRDEQTTKLLLDGCQEKSTSVDNDTPTQDLEDLLQGKSSTNVVDDGMPSSPGKDLPGCSHLSDEQPLLKWLDGMKSAKVSNNEGISHGMALDAQDDATPMQSPVVVNCANVEKSEIVLPFAKCSPVWNSIESLEVFQRNPQRPHFSPLASCKEDCREGIAIGHMITFANLVERTLKLQLSTPQSIIVSTLDTLAELENHGFDVESVRKRLNELQALKVRADQLEESSKEAEGVITKLNLEKRKLEELLDKVETSMREIQEKLAVAASMKETKVEKIVVWQSKVNSFVDSMESVKRDFERVAASPLWDVGV